jgi:ActR/RegA family two-component response regulator
VDLFMPPLGGVALIAAINYAVPGTRVFVLVGEAREATLQAAYAAGALGFVTKNGSVQHVPPDLGWSGAGPAGVSRVPTPRVAAGPASVNDDRFTTAGA